MLPALGRDGEALGLSVYEYRVLGFVPRDRGPVMQRAVSDGAEGRPHEVHLYRFPDQAALDAYLADPDRTALTSETASSPGPCCSR